MENIASSKTLNNGHHSERVTLDMSDSSKEAGHSGTAVEITARSEENIEQLDDKN